MTATRKKKASARRRGRAAPKPRPAAGQAKAPGKRARPARGQAKATSRRKAARPRLGLVTRPRPRPVRAATPGEMAAAADSEKRKLLFELARARAVVRTAIRGLDAETAERPFAPGKWNVRQIVLHLAIRDRARLDELESTLGGKPHSWAGYTPEQMSRANLEDLASLGQIDWEHALRLLNGSRRELGAALEQIPEEPAERWGPGHPLGRMLLGLPPHDFHHAEAIRRWREEQGV